MILHIISIVKGRKDHFIIFGILRLAFSLQSVGLVSKYEPFRSKTNQTAVAHEPVRIHQTNHTHRLSQSNRP